MNHYYVYAYIRATDSSAGKAGTPYYIGKDQGKRAFSTQHNVPVPKDRSRIVFVSTNLTVFGSLAIERKMIRWYGRKDTKTGILNNLTDGGEGAGGWLMSQATKEKIRSAHLGKPKSKEHCANFVKARIGQTQTAASNAKRSLATKGIPKTEETKAKMKIGMTGLKKTVVTCPHCETNGGQGNMFRYHFDNCKYLKFIQTLSEWISFSPQHPMIF